MKIVKLAICLLGTTSALVAGNLPEPYASVAPVLPFDPHGFYYNGPYVERVVYANPQIKVIVEVGSWLGASTRHFAHLLPKDGKVYAVDHWQGSVEHQAGGSAWYSALPYLYDQFLSNVIHAQLTDKIIPVRMSSVQAAASLKVKPDLIYIDAAHDTNSVLQDLEAWYPHVKGQGILCGDDYGWPTVAAAVNSFANAQGLKVEVAENGVFWVLKEK